jgi:FAD dependent oxidoreductase
MTRDTLKPSQATLPTPNSTVSFWHREPSKILLGHRTTDHLPTEADVVIIGSGIAGAFAAHYLAEGNHGRGLNVVMLEAREACWGATGRVGSSLLGDCLSFTLSSYSYSD